MHKLIAHVLAGATLLATAGAAAQKNPHVATEVNFAFGGAQSGSANLTAALDPLFGYTAAQQGLVVPGLAQQLDLAEQSLGRVNANRDIFWLYIGTNDILGVPFTPMPGDVDPNDPAAVGAWFGATLNGAVGGLIGNVSAALERSYGMGARYIVVPNLMPVGSLPLLSLFGVPAQVQGALNQASAGYNAALAGFVIPQFLAAHPDAHVVHVDVADIVAGLAADGYNVTDVCPAPPGGSCDGYLFGDVVHPTSGVYARWAEDAANQLAVLFSAPDETVDNLGRFHRVITLGDSFSDTGAFYATYTTALPNQQPFGRFTDGRFSDGDNVIDHLEALLRVLYPSSPAFLP